MNIEQLNPVAREFVLQGQEQHACYMAADAVRYLVHGKTLTDSQVVVLARMLYRRLLRGVYPNVLDAKILAQDIFS